MPNPQQTVSNPARSTTRCADKIAALKRPAGSPSTVDWLGATARRRMRATATPNDAKAPRAKVSFAVRFLNRASSCQTKSTRSPSSDWGARPKFLDSENRSSARAEALVAASSSHHVGQAARIASSLRPASFNSLMRALESASTVVPIFCCRFLRLKRLKKHVLRQIGCRLAFVRLPGTTHEFHPIVRRYRDGVKVPEIRCPFDRITKPHPIVPDQLRTQIDFVLGPIGGGGYSPQQCCYLRSTD